MKKTAQTRDSVTVQRQNRRYAAYSVLLAWAIAAVLPIIPPWQGVEERVFDHLSVATTPGKPQLPITIHGSRHDAVPFRRTNVRGASGKRSLLDIRVADRLGG